MSQFLLPIARQTHALKSESNFVLPPYDGSLTLPEIFDFHAEHNPNHPFYTYAKASGGTTSISYSQLVSAAHRAARYIADIRNIDLDADPATFPTIAILATSETITYTTTVLGLVRAGIPVFLVSPRCTPVAAAALLEKTKPAHILVSADAATSELADGAVTQLKLTNGTMEVPAIEPMPTFEQLYMNNAPFARLPPRKRNLDVPRLILHSSGSTSLPKPITWNDRFLLQLMISSQYATNDLCGEILAFHGVPSFHTITWAFIAIAAGSGLTLALFEPKIPAIIPTSDTIFNGFVKTAPTWGFAVPSFIEEWSTDETKIEFLRSLKGLSYGGGPLNKYVGDKIVKQGVRISIVYGATEFGVGNICFSDYLGEDWEYMAINPHLASEFIAVGDGTYEMIVVARLTTELPKINAKFGGEDAYSSSDLLVPHPTKSGLWKIVGRSDDQITLATGEKTSPVPLEAIISQDPHVFSAVMFGRGRLQNGVIIEPKPQYAFDPKDEKKVAEFRNLIWPKVEEMNASTLTHSRVFKEMILIASPSKPFAFTPKGTPRRAHIIAEYEAEIEAIYKALDDMDQFEPPSEWTEKTSFEFINSVVSSVLKRNVGKSEDLFEGGCDSMQATWIRNSTMHALRKSPSVAVNTLSSNIVYEHPTIGSLAKYVLAIATGGASEQVRKAEDVNAFLARFIQNFPQHVPSAPASVHDVVLVTGTTGALGSALLARLVENESVAKVYAFNRPSRSPKSVSVRQGEALKSRGYDPEIVNSPKVVMIEGDITGSGLGVDAALEDEIRHSVTHIIHNAWRVDFNLSLASYETTVAGVRTLVDFALSSPQPTPPHLQFTSSIGVLRNYTSSEVVKEVPIEDAGIPLGQGYAESKWVAEMILHAAAKATTLKPMVVRVGQISGGLNGSWNTSDWVPAIIKSSVALGCIPQLTGVCAWIPLDLTAQSLIELRSEADPAVTLVHPYPAPYLDLFKAIAEELSLPFASYSEWYNRLEKATTEVAEANDANRSAQFAEQVPAGTLLEFFKGAVAAEATAKDDSREVMGMSTFETNNSRKGSLALRNARQLTAGDARSWIGYWRSVGFLSA